MADLVGDGAPHTVEDCGRAGEVEAGELAVVEHHLGCLPAIGIDQVDHRVGESGLL